MKIEKLKYWLKSKNKIFDDFNDVILDRENPEQARMFIDRDSKVLFIAHIDTVQKPKYMLARRTKSKKLKRVYAQGLDDRLGCMLAYELSKELKADLLITDHEETARSTGQFHNLKDYNWIVEFDRAGIDVVTYGLDSQEFYNALNSFWDIGQGSFSDVCQLKTTACCMNLGIGYEFAHSKDSFVDVLKFDKQIEQFKLFYDEYKDVKFEQEKENYFSHNNDECDICNVAKNDCESIHGYLICSDCFDFMMQEYDL